MEADIAEVKVSHYLRWQKICGETFNSFFVDLLTS